MTDITPAPVTAEELGKWFTLVAQLNKLKQEEHFMRMRIFRYYFTQPKEGTNTYTLPDQYQLKAVHVITRKVLEEQMQALCTRPEVAPGQFGPSKLEAAGVRVDQLIKWTPDLAIKEYRELTEEQRHLVDQMLEVKEGSPQVKIEPPAKPRGKAAAKPKPNEVEEDKGPQA